MNKLQYVQQSWPCVVLTDKWKFLHITNFVDGDAGDVQLLPRDFNLYCWKEILKFVKS